MLRIFLCRNVFKRRKAKFFNSKSPECFPVINFPHDEQNGRKQKGGSHIKGDKLHNAKQVYKENSCQDKEIKQQISVFHINTLLLLSV